MALTIQQEYSSIIHKILYILEKQYTNFDDLPKSQKERLVVDMVEKIHNDALNLLKTYGK